MKKIPSILVAVMAAFVGTSYAALAQETTKPNVIVMMVDNLGWGELGA